MMAAIYNMIKSGLGLSFEDDGEIQIGKSKFLGRDSQTVESLVPYGTFGMPMAKVRQILFSLRSKESNIAAFNVDSANRIKKNTKSGEYGIGSPLTGANIYFKENGDCVIEIPKENFNVTAGTEITMDAPAINLNSGTKGVAREDDTTIVNSVTDSLMITWIATVSAAINLLAPGSIPPPAIPSSISGKINSASGSVKAGD